MGTYAWEKVSYVERKKEDQAACKLLDCKFIHLDFLDAPYRHKEFTSINKLFTANPQNYENISKQLAAKLEELILTYKPLKVFAPMGIGWHIDHLLTFAAVQDLRASSARKIETEFYFYEDRPYTFTPGSLDLRLAELHVFPATAAGMTSRFLRISRNFFYFPVQAWSWSFSKMVSAAQGNPLKKLWGFILNLKRNFRILLQPARHAALLLQLDGSEEDLNFAHQVAQNYVSQFPYLFTNDENFINLSRNYARSLNLNAAYAERIWIL